MSGAFFFLVRLLYMVASNGPGDGAARQDLLADRPEVGSEVACPSSHARRGHLPSLGSATLTVLRQCGHPALASRSRLALRVFGVAVFSCLHEKRRG